MKTSKDVGKVLRWITKGTAGEGLMFLLHDSMFQHFLNSMVRGLSEKLHACIYGEVLCLLTCKKIKILFKP